MADESARTENQILPGPSSNRELEGGTVFLLRRGESRLRNCRGSEREEAPASRGYRLLLRLNPTRSMGKSELWW